MWTLRTSISVASDKFLVPLAFQSNIIVVPKLTGHPTWNVAGYAELVIDIPLVGTTIISSTKINLNEPRWLEKKISGFKLRFQRQPWILSGLSLDIYEEQQ